MDIILKDIQKEIFYEKQLIYSIMVEISANDVNFRPLLPTVPKNKRRECKSPVLKVLNKLENLEHS